MAAEPAQRDPPGDPRVYFAGQRTVLPWVRTGVALMGFGFVVARFGLFLREIAAAQGAVVPRQGPVSAWAGTALILVGVAVLAVGAARFSSFVRAFRAGDEAVPRSAAPELTIAAVLGATGLFLALYLIAR